MSETGESERLIRVRHVEPGATREDDDRVAVEEPMEIRIGFESDGRPTARSLSITMRTPGHDFELAAGFLFTEGILDSAEQVRGIDFCGPAAPGRATSNIVRVDLAPGVEIDLKRLERHFYATSSCGICGKAALDALHTPGLVDLGGSGPQLTADVIRQLPDRLRAAQPVFSRTGGLHAAGRVTAEGDLVAVREDVGRHNAVDKLLGRAFLDGQTPLLDEAMVISGRASFEILQKALKAGVPLIVAVGAPSSLAVDIARRFGMTLIGFASERRFNVYTGPERVAVV